MPRLPGYQSRSVGYVPDPGAMGYSGAGYARSADDLPYALQLDTIAKWAAFGLTLSNLYLCQDADTQLSDESAAAHLARTGGTFGVESDWPPRLAVAFEGVNEYASADVFDDDGATSQAFILFAENAVTATNNGLFSRNVNASSPGYRALVRDTTGGLRWRLRDGVPNNIEAEIAEDHRGYVGPMVFTINHDAEEIGVYSTLGSDTADISSAGSAASAQAFEVGIARGTANGLAGNRLHLLGRLSGAAAEVSVDWSAICDKLAQGSL